MRQHPLARGGGGRGAMETRANGPIDWRVLSMLLPERGGRYAPPMANEALVASVKQILTLFRERKEAEGYAAYTKLFTSPEFATYAPQDQRQALKLMISLKVIPSSLSPHLVGGYRTGMAPLKALIDAHDDPHDYELYGICQIVTGDEKGAAETFRKALNMERARNPQSDLCGSLMKWVAAV